MTLALHTPRNTTWTVMLGLTALMLSALAMPAHAAPPNPPATPVFVPNEAYSTTAVSGSTGPIPFSWLQFKQNFGLPGAMTVPSYPSYDPTNANAYSTVTGNPYLGLDAGNEYPGDYIRAFLLGDYGLTEPPTGGNNFFDTILGGTSGLVAWTAPDVNYTTTNTQPITVDDDNNYNALTLSASSTTVYGFAQADAGWTALVSGSAQIPTNIQDYNAEGYTRILAIPRPQNEGGTGNAITFSANVSFFHWYPNVVTPGAYTVYAYFPSQNATVGTGAILPQERHVTDAQYQILINGVVVQTSYVDQQSGGTWVPIGGPFNVPAQVATDATGNVPTLPNPVTVEVRLSNTTVPDPNGGDPNLTSTFVVADAIQLRGEDGSTTRMLSSPIVVNKTDYPELFSGYQTLGTHTGYAGDSGVGGQHPEYQQEHLTLNGTAGTTGSITAITGGILNTDTFSGAYPTAPAVVPTGSGVNNPIDQLVYFTRDETIISPTDPTAVQTVGAVYCVDGRNGNVVWRYPATNPVTVDYGDPINYSIPATYAGTAPVTAFSATAYPPPIGGNYGTTPAVAQNPATFSTSFFAQWKFPAPTAGTGGAASYQIFVWNPLPTVAETHVTNAVYSVNGAICIADQTQGGQFVPLININGNSTFQLTPGISVVQLSNQLFNGVPTGTPAPVITAGAVEFVPADSLGTVDSTPAVVRNMRVLTVPGSPDKWETRTVVVVADNLGKVYALDAAGNDDGNDTLYDSSAVPQPVSFNSDGTVNGTYVLPYTPKQYGTTRAYWIWQPSALNALATTVIADNADPAAPAAGQNRFTPSATTNPTGFATLITTPTATETNAYPPPAGTALTDTVIATPTAPTLPDYVTWSPNLNAQYFPAGTAPCSVYIWYPAVIPPGTPTTSAHYIVVDAGGVAHPVTVDQSTGGGAWKLLGTFNFGSTANPPPAPTAANAAGQYALTPNTIVLDNSSAVAADAGKTVYADAVRVDVLGNSQLIVPLAFQMCSPTVSLAATDTTIYTTVPAPPAGGPPTMDATIYIGNSNGLMYSLEGGGLNGTPPVTDIRRNASVDQNTPTAGVNWWFNFGGTLNDTDGENTLGTTYAPAYDPYDGPFDDPANPTVPDGLLYFSTFSPQLTTDGGPVNQGYLFAVDAKYGPFADGGDTGGVYSPAVPTSRVATEKYNNNPVPYWTFPDKFGTLKYDLTIYHNGMPTPPSTPEQPISLGADHLITSGIPATTLGAYQYIPAAAAVGDSAASPLVYTASVTTDTVPVNPGRRVYFAANDPNTDEPVSGRVYGIDPTTGKLDPNSPGTNQYPFIYPATAAAPATGNSPNNPNGDPNLIALTDTLSTTQDLVYNGPASAPTNAFGAFTDQEAATGYFVSTSPVAAPITYPIAGAANLPANITTAVPNGPGIVARQVAQMLYMGDQQGYMHYVDLRGIPPTVGTTAADLPRDVYDYQVGDNIISTPALLPNASGEGYLIPEAPPTGTNPPLGLDIGGALFVTTEGGNLVELEAFPTIDPATSATAIRLKDWTYSGPGGFSSPAVGSFNTTNATTSATDLGNTEWVYVGGDQGICYGFTPNNTTGNGTATGGSAPPTGAPGTYVPPNDLAPPNTVPPNRNFAAQVTATQPTGTTINFDPANGPPLNPVFDWGQTAYIEIFGADDPKPATAGIDTPKGIRITFTIKPFGRTGRGLRTINKVIDLQAAKNVYTAGTGWPLTGATLTGPGSSTATGTVVGPKVAVYAYQLGDGTSDPQTPGGKIQIANITEQIQYLDTSTPPKIVTVTLNGTPDQGSLIRKAGSAAGLNATAVIDEGTFSILNPLAVRGAGRSLGDTSAASPQVPGVYTYYNLTLSPVGRYQYNTSNYLGGLGPFSGVPVPTTGNAVSRNNAVFQDAQPAMSNGNSILATAPLGGAITTATGTISNATNTLAQIQQPKQFQVIVAVDAGLVNDGTNGQSATPQYFDPPVTNSAAIGSNSVTPPTATNLGQSNGDYGEALLDILDRSALGTINTPITRLRMNNPQISWNDNSETGAGSGGVINPLPWDQLPQAYYVSGRTSSPDYPDIGSSNTQVELLQRNHPPAGLLQASNVSNSVDANYAPGSDTIITAGDATLAPSDADMAGMRHLYPNAAMVQIAVPKYQPANLESYSSLSTTVPTGGGTLTPGINHADMVDQKAVNVAEGYIARGEVFIDTRGNGRRDRTEAYRGVQVWAGVPANTSSSIAETTVDIGSVPAGFGLWGTTGPNNTTIAPTNDSWSPLIPGTTTPSPYAAFFKPFTIINEGNVNLMNVHLDQRLTGTDALGNSLSPFLPFTSDTINSPYGLGYPQSIVPSSDYPVTAANQSTQTLTGTRSLPLVRSNFDLFDFAATFANNTWTDAAANAQPGFNTFVPNPELLNGSVLATPGATAHKARPGDPQGAVMTVPDTPHNNYSNISGWSNLATSPYSGRPVISMAIPLATPAGTYAQTVRAFEGYDPPAANGPSQFVGPVYAGTPVTALSPWAPLNNTMTPVSALSDVGGVPLQTVSDPGTTLRATVVESRLTDGVPLPVATSTFSNAGVQSVVTTSAVLPMVDSGPTVTTGAAPIAVYNSNDIQPWAFYDYNANQYTLLWASARSASTTALQQTDPYDLYGTSLASLITPTNPSATNASWWTAPVSLTFPPALTPPGATPIAPDALASTNPSVVQLGANAATALWVTTSTQSSQKSYVLQASSITYSASTKQPQFSTTPTTLLTRSAPIFGPRGTFVYAGGSGSLALSALTVAATATAPSDPAPGNAPLIFWSTRSGGRSQIFYWPAVKKDPNNAGNVVVSAGALPVPADLRSVANPTAVARIVSVYLNGSTVPTIAGVVDVTYSGVSAATGQSDVYTSRYLVDVNGDTPPTATDATHVATLTLDLTTSLPIVPLTNTAYAPSEPTETEQMVNDGQNGFQSRDTAWLRDVKAFELDALIQAVQVVTTTNAQGQPTSTSTVMSGATLPLIPSDFFTYLQKNPSQTTYRNSRAAVYDRSSGQWIFTVNWNDLYTYYGTGTSGLSTSQGNLVNFVNWLYHPATAYTGTTLNAVPNLVVYTNPAAGTVRLGAPLPLGNTITSSPGPVANSVVNTNFVTLQGQFNPQAQRVTFQNNANVASIAFIDNTAKTNAGPSGATSGGTVSQNVVTSRYWYLYRKTGIGAGNGAATNAVLYYKTRRLTVVLPVPIQLTAVATATPGVYTYHVTNLQVTIGLPAVDVTQDVDVDWSRGRLYFPAGPTNLNPAGYDGQTVTVTYTDSSGAVHQVTSTTPQSYTVQWQDEQQANDPIGTTGTTGGEHVIPISNAVNESDPCAFLNPAADATQANGNNQSTAHSVWLFWSSSRNANGAVTNGIPQGAGADLYWETIDPRFEVVPGS